MELRCLPIMGLLLLPLLLPAQADMPPGSPSGATTLEQGAILQFRFPEKGSPSPDAHLLRGERGTLEGLDLYLTISPLPDPADQGTDGEENPAPSDDPLAADYLVIDTGKPIRRDWLQPGVIWGVHHLTLRDSVDRNDFQAFIHRYWSPTRSDALPDSKLIFVRALSGPRKGEFSYIWFIDSEETRDYYFPQSQEPSRMYGEFEKGWDWINDEEHLGKYLAAPEDADFTDYIVVR